MTPVVSLMTPESLYCDLSLVSLGFLRAAHETTGMRKGRSRSSYPEASGPRSTVTPCEIRHLRTRMGVMSILARLVQVPPDVGASAECFLLGSTSTPYSTAWGILVGHVQDHHPASCPFIESLREGEAVQLFDVNDVLT